MNGGTGDFLLDKAAAFALGPLRSLRGSACGLGQPDDFVAGESRIVRLYQHLSEKGERVMSKQVLRSGTSIGANITEGHYGASKADFINKYVIAEKEAGETLYWLRLLTRSGYLEEPPATQSLLADCDELIRLLASSIKTARSRT